MASHPWPFRPQPLRALSRKSRPLLATVLSVLAVASAALVAATPAAAEPTVSEIEDQIDSAWNKLEPIIEQHNATRTQLAVRKKRAAALAKKIQPLQLQIDIAMNRVGEFAAIQYKGGNVSAVNAITSGGSPTKLAEQLQILDQFAKRQQAEIHNVVTLRDKYDAQKKPLDAMIDDLTKTEKALGIKSKQIDAEIEKLQKLRLKAYGSSGGLGSLRPVPCPTTYPGGDASKVIRFACSQIGKPYVWAAAGPSSYDCSGLMLASWAKVGISLPHNARQQRGMMRSVSRSELRAGDLVFYFSDLHHVGMYAGKIDGVDWMVHAPTSGDVVRMAKMDAFDIHSFGRPS